MKGEVGLRVLVGGLLALVCVFFFQLFYPYHFFLKEQLQLFLFTPDYILSYFHKPAWLACLTGDFFTQFYYFRWGGPIVLSAVFLLEWLLCAFILKRFTKEYYSLLAVFPVVMEWIFHYSTSYTLSHTFSTIWAMSLFLLYVRQKPSAFKLITGFLLIPVVYWLTGGGMWIFLLLLLGTGILLREYNWIYGGFFIVAAVVVPLFVRHLYLLTIEQAWFYPADSFTLLWPGIILAGIIGLVYVSSLQKLVTGLKGRIVTLLLLICFLGVGTYTKANFIREKFLSMDCEGYFGNWDRVYESANKYQLQHTTATYFTNLALSHRGEMGEKLMQYYQPASFGLFLEVGPASSILNIFFSNEAFFHIGDMNMAQHSAMLGMIFIPSNRSSRMCKRLAEINLVNEDIPATEKYLRMLDKTLFHRKWSARYREMLYADSTAINPWLSQKRSQVPAYDTIRKGNDYPASLHVLMESNPGNRIALDYLLSFYLLNKDIESFVQTFNRYWKDRPGAVPRVYGEGLLIWLAGKKATEQEVKKYAIPTHVIEEFLEYTQLHTTNEGELTSLQEKYGQSYWFYYHFAQMVNK